ncbi:MAG: hypothetical protein ACRCWR_06190 [Saezia sp.]
MASYTITPEQRAGFAETFQRTRRTGWQDDAPEQETVAQTFKRIFQKTMPIAFGAGAFCAGFLCILAYHIFDWGRRIWRYIRPYVIKCIWPWQNLVVTMGIPVGVIGWVIYFCPSILYSTRSSVAIHSGWQSSEALPSGHGFIDASLFPPTEAPGEWGTGGSRANGKGWAGIVYNGRDERLENIVSIVQAANECLPGDKDLDRLILMAVMTGIVEANLKNINYGDKSSLGMFQQKPEYWGRSRDVKGQAIKFFHGVDMPGYHTPGLLDQHGWRSAPLGRLCQDVQRSAYPDRYAKVESQARELLNSLLR